jgi:hypothetical protein
LDASGVTNLGLGGVTTHVNKVHHVTTITRVAQQLGENEDWLRDVASEMEIEAVSSGSMASEKTASWRSPASALRA